MPVIHPSFGLANTRGISGSTINSKNCLDVNIVGSSANVTPVAARAAAALTNSYVASSAIDVRNASQVIFFIAFTIGSLTDADIKVEFSPNGTTWFQETFAAIDGDTSTETNGVHTYAATGNYRLPIEVAGEYIRISAIGNGTVTGSSMAITMIAK